MTASMVALLIPTMNRSGFLIRQLEYYKKMGFKGQICIGDSSNAEHLNPTKEAITILSRDLDIVFREYPNTNDAEVLKRLLEFTTKPYAAFVADDDLLIPKAVEECASFLERNKDYNSAHGKAVTVTVKSSAVHGVITGARPYPQPVIDGNTAETRILEHLANYQVTLFSVHRKLSWQEMYKDISMIKDKTFASELLPCCLSIIQGKAKELNCLYLIRQDHNQRYYLPDKEKWVRKPEWPQLYDTFRNLLSNALHKKDGMKAEIAREIIDRAFSSYMVSLLGNNWRKDIGKGNQRNRLPLAFETAFSILQSLKGRFLAPQQDMHNMLSDLTNSSSPQYNDFMPVYQAITGADKKLVR